MGLQERQERLLIGKCLKTISCVFFMLMFLAFAGCGGGGDDNNTDSGGDITDPGNDDPIATVSLSGTITAPDGVVIDSDVNDINEDYAENDSISSAQLVSNPVSIGGYVNVAGYGADGQSYESGDRNDYFSIQLSSGDRITLAIGDTDAGDLDLYLYDSSGATVDASLGLDQYESLTIAESETYYVRVYAYSGASNYILTIGTDLDSACVDTLSTQHKFVSGQAIVRFKESSQAAAATATDRLASMGMTRSAGSAGREMLLSFDDRDVQSSTSKTLGVTGYSTVAEQADTALAAKINTLLVIKALRKRSDVQFADPNYIVRHYETEPDDTYYYLQWHYPQINLPQAWDETHGSEDVIVAVVDTGVLMGHPDLSGNLTDTGYDFISSTSISNDGDGIDDNPDDPGDSATPGASSFHGTHCAGTIAASTNNNAGVAGVGWNTKVMPIRVLGIDGGTNYDVMQGVRYAAGLENDSGTVPAQIAHIISMSLGGDGHSSSEQSVFDAVREAGVIVIAAAGNSATSTPSYPAAYDGVISVSAVNINSTLASYSNYGGTIDVAAPGGDSGDYDGDGYTDLVWSTCGDDSSGTIQYNYEAKGGTSMATPHVAGVVALMKSLASDLTPDELDGLLEGGYITNDIGDEGRDNYYGYGLIDAYKAVEAVYEGIPTALTVSPTSINFGTSSTSATLTVSMVGDGDISVESYSADSTGWLTVTEASVDANGLGSYTVTANRDDVSLSSEGTYAGAIAFNASSGNTLTVSVSLRVRSTSTAADAGYHYVLLIDSDTNEVLQQDNVQAVDGRYTYSFNGVTKGDSYVIIAGSDRDNDGDIGDAGEAVGAYTSLDHITTLEATGDLTGLDFTTDLKLTVSIGALANGVDGTDVQFIRLR